MVYIVTDFGMCVYIENASIEIELLLHYLCEVHRTVHRSVHRTVHRSVHNPVHSTVHSPVPRSVHSPVPRSVHRSIYRFIRNLHKMSDRINL